MNLMLATAECYLRKGHGSFIIFLLGNMQQKAFPQRLPLADGRGGRADRHERGEGRGPLGGKARPRRSSHRHRNHGRLSHRRRSLSGRRPPPSADGDPKSSRQRLPERRLSERRRGPDPSDRHGDPAGTRRRCRPRRQAWCRGRSFQPLRENSRGYRRLFWRCQSPPRSRWAAETRKEGA